VKWIIALAPLVGEEMPFRKRTTREKTVLQNAACGRNQNKRPGIFRQRINRGAEKATGNPLLERRCSAHGDTEARPCTLLINGEAFTAHCWPHAEWTGPSGKNFYTAGGIPRLAYPHTSLRSIFRGSLRRVRGRFPARKDPPDCRAPRTCDAGP
jgi:hypothetical protein